MWNYSRLRLRNQPDELGKPERKSSVTCVLSSPPTPHGQRRPPIRCLFINWTDGSPASQFTVPDDYHLQVDLAGNLRPERFTVYGDALRTELWINAQTVRSAMVLDIPSDRPMVAPEIALR